jgi:60 kDa SS-A/Ro ribonucleoprotein
MSRFNTVAVDKTKTVNLAGGEAYTQTPELEFASILLTSMVEDQFYRSSGDTQKRLIALLKDLDPMFAAKAAVYTRNVYGMRSISHVAAGEISQLVKGQSWTKDFMAAVVRRPDDMTEILSYYLNKYGKPIPNSMKKGFAKAFGKFDEYQLAKYRGEGKAVSLVDIANLVRPVPTEKNGAALTKLINDELRSTGTWESALTEAGKAANTAEEKVELKKAAWSELVTSGKIGQLALLKNLRNILEQAPEVVSAACALLTDEKRVRQGMILPFRYVTALKEIEQVHFDGTREVIVALSKAVDIALSNVPKMDGRTLVVLDVSGSMGGGYGFRSGNGSGKSPAEIGALFASVLVKANNADFMTFDTQARYINVNPTDSTLTIQKALMSTFTGGGTDFKPIFRTASKAYDRVIILSDMQGWAGYYSPSAELNAYAQRHGVQPHVYSFDLNGLGTLQFPEKRVYALAGFSDKVFDIMEMLEADPRALVNTIKAVEF